jgi:hypothetical protein
MTLKNDCEKKRNKEMENEKSISFHFICMKLLEKSERIKEAILLLLLLLLFFLPSSFFLS